MGSDISNLKPIEKSERIASLDIMRGVVLCGILLMNINGMALAEPSYSNPTIAGGSEGLDLYTWMATNMFFEGTMRALFSLLFGVGMFVLLDRLEKSGAGIEAANIYFRRLMWMMLFGIIHAYLLLWVGEILFTYSLMGFLVYSFRKLAPKTLIIIACVLFIIGTLWNYGDYVEEQKLTSQAIEIETYKSEGKELTQELKEVNQELEKRAYERSSEHVNSVNEDMRKNYFHVVAFLAPINVHFHSYYTYRYDAWDVLSMMLLGIALFKLDILSARRSYRFYGLMALLGYLVGISVNYFETTTIINGDFSALSFAKSGITYDFGRVPTAMGHIAMIMLLSKAPILIFLKRALSSVGKMALTNYLMHSVFAMFIFTGAGFGLFGTFMRHELIYIVLSIWLFQLIVSPIWLKYYHYGPAEWLWRYLSYLKKPAFKIRNTDQ